MLDALARALELDAGERAHLFHLARVELPLDGAESGESAPRELVAMVQELAPHPAYLLNARTDVLAINRQAEAMLGSPTRAPDGRRNMLWWLFTRTDGRTPQMEETARNSLARFRAAHARRIGDPDFAALIEALEHASPDFAALWDRHEVLAGQFGTKTIAHPVLGTLHLRHVQTIPTEHPDLRLTQFTPLDEATRAILAAI